jgi:hypothetical protein
MTASLLLGLLAAGQAAPLHPAYEWLIRDWVCREGMLASGPVWRFLEIRREGDALVGRIGTRFPGRRAPRIQASLRITGSGETARLVYTGPDGVPAEYRLRNSGHEGELFERQAGSSIRRIRFDHQPFHMVFTMSEGEGRETASVHYYPDPPLLAGRCDGGPGLSLRPRHSPQARSGPSR